MLCRQIRLAAGQAAAHDDAIEKLNVLSAYQVVSRELRRLTFRERVPERNSRRKQSWPGNSESTARRCGKASGNSKMRVWSAAKGASGLRCRCPSGKILIASDLRPRMRQVTFRELWEAALVLEPACAPRSAPGTAETEQVNALRGNIERTRNALNDTRQCTTLDTEFHALVTDGAHNTALLLSREPVGLLLFPAFEILSPSLAPANSRMLTLPNASPTPSHSRMSPRRTRCENTSLTSTRMGDGEAQP